MNTLNPTAAKSIRCHIPSLNPHRPSLSKPLSSFSFRTPPPPLPRLSYSPIKACSQNPNNKPTPIVPLIPFLTPLKATLITAVTAAAIFFSRFYLHSNPSIAVAPISPPSIVETSNADRVADEEMEKGLEHHLLSNPHDIDALKNLMEIKIKSKKIPQAIEILDKLIDIEKDEIEWPMMKAHLYGYNGQFQLARNGFNELLKKDPFLVEAYHGLVTIVSQEESSDDLVDINRRIEEAATLCKKENKKSDLRDFKLLSAQIRVLEGRYDEALTVYHDLVKEEPRDFRPYLCQGIIYTLLRKNGEAEKSFETYRRLVPKEHPYARYFDDNMIATKVFAQKMENEGAMAKS